MKNGKYKKRIFYYKVEGTRSSCGCLFVGVLLLVCFCFSFLKKFVTINMIYGLQRQKSFCNPLTTALCSLLSLS